MKTSRGKNRPSTPPQALLGMGQNQSGSRDQGPLKGENKGHKKGNLKRENLQKEVGPDHTAPRKPESCPVGNREPWKGLKMGMDMIRFAL